MNYDVELFIGVCLTYDDFKKFKTVLISSLENLYDAFGGNCTVYIVIQSERHLFNVCSLYARDWIEFHQTDYFGISNARNLCIEACLKKNAKFIVFHDASIYWTKSAADFIYRCRNKIETPRVNYLFNDDFISQQELYPLANTHTFTLEYCNPIYNSYVWTFLFRVNKICRIRFDIEFGPGEDTKYKSGEDVLFLFEYFEQQNITIYPLNKKVAVIHPTRPSDYSKHLLYAYGQGVLFRKLLLKYKRASIALDVMLFFGNAFVRCLFFKKNAFKILHNRLKGFLGG
ncbi:hypothetical protein MLT33_01630 [Escherichia coli]|nr:hypothetical protein [Escherichia coli]